MSKQITDPQSSSSIRSETQANQPEFSERGKERDSQEHALRERYEAMIQAKQARRRGLAEGRALTAVAAGIMAFLLILGSFSHTCLRQNRPPRLRPVSPRTPTARRTSPCQLSPFPHIRPITR